MPVLCKAGCGKNAMLKVNNISWLYIESASELNNIQYFYSVLKRGILYVKNAFTKPLKQKSILQ